MNHPRHDLDEILSNSVRLSIVAALQDVERAEFALVQHSVEITSPALSKQIATLESAHYVTVTKGRIGRRPRTWLSLTAEGRDALARHLAALHAIANWPIPPVTNTDAVATRAVRPHGPG